MTKQSKFVVVYVDPNQTAAKIQEYLQLQWEDGWEYVDGLASTPTRYVETLVPMHRVVFRRINR